jgi:hypothetical protein
LEPGRKKESGGVGNLAFGLQFADTLILFQLCSTFNLTTIFAVDIYTSSRSQLLL